MADQIVFGAGPVGRAIAAGLVSQGLAVRLASRSGTGPALAGVRRMAVDAADADAVARAAAGCDVIYNALNPDYTRWVTDWPPMATALLSAAETTGAVLVTVSNLYAYGPVSGALTEDLPLAAPGKKGQVRAQMFQQALAAHEAGRAKVVEVRASDYIGPGAESHMGDRVVPRILAGKSVKVVGATDQPHSWTYTDDVATLAIAAGQDPSSWGRAWHVPSNPARTQAEVVADLAAVAGVPAPAVSAYPAWLMSAMGMVNPMIRELKETNYQFESPFVLDSSAAEGHFGIKPTPWDQVLAATVASFPRAAAA